MNPLHLTLQEAVQAEPHDQGVALHQRLATLELRVFRLGGGAHRGAGGPTGQLGPPSTRGAPRIKNSHPIGRGLVECSHFTIPLLPPRRKESYLARVTPPCVRGRAALIAGTRAPGSRRAS